MSNVRFIRFDKDIWEQTDIPVLGKLILNHIRSFEDKGLPCFTSIDGFCEIYGCVRKGVEYCIGELIDKEYITTHDQGPRTYLQIIWKKDISVDDYFDSDIFEV
jgi:hypothetical protein